MLLTLIKRQLSQAFSALYFQYPFCSAPQTECTPKNNRVANSRQKKMLPIQIQIYVCFGVSCAGKQWLKAESRIRIKPITAGPQQSDNVSGVMHRLATPIPHRSRTPPTPYRFNDAC